MAGNVVKIVFEMSFPSLLMSAEDERRRARIGDDTKKTFALLPIPTIIVSNMKGYLKNQVTSLLNEIQAILKHNNKTVADLANDIDRNYNQVYDWVVRRQFNPQAAGLLLLQEWRDKNISKTSERKN